MDQQLIKKWSLVEIINEMPENIFFIVKSINNQILGNWSEGTWYFLIYQITKLYVKISRSIYINGG